MSGGGWAVEACACGHARIAHGDRVGGLAMGHGECRAHVGRRPCPCERFTWAGATLVEARANAELRARGVTVRR